MMGLKQRSGKIEAPSVAAGRVVLIYAVFAALWIFASDAALEALVRNPADWARAGMFKGLLFVAATALLLYGLLIRLLKTTGEERQALAAHYAKLIEQARDIVLLIDPAGRIVEANRAAEAAYGYRHAELLGMTMVDLRAPDSLADVERQWAVAASTEGVLFETRHRHRDGRVFPVEVSSRAIEIEGKLYRQSFIRDITERNKAEEALRESEKRFRTLVEQAPEGIFIQTQRRFAYVNTRLVTLLGATSPEQLLGDLVESRIHPDFLTLVRDRISQLNEQRLPQGLADLVFVRLDGSRLDVSVSGVPFESKGEQGALVFVRDITERKRMEEALRHTQALLANAEKIGRVGGWEIDVQTRQTTWTEAVYDIHELDGTDRLTVDEGINYYTPASRPIIEQAVQRAIERGEPFDLELEIITAKGNRRSVHAMGKAELSRGKVTGFFQDITERKQLEIERQKFFLLAESSSEFIGMCDLDMNPLYVNPAGRRMVGLPDMAAACRVKVKDYYFSEDQQFIAEDFFPRVLREGHGEVEIRLRHFQTGEPIWMYYYLFSVRDASGAPIGWATVSRDISERKRADETLTKQLDELRRWQQAMIGREDRIITVKQEVNDLLAKLGQPPRYASPGEEGSQK